MPEVIVAGLPGCAFRSPLHNAAYGAFRQINEYLTRCNILGVLEAVDAGLTVAREVRVTGLAPVACRILALGDKEPIVVPIAGALHVFGFDLR